ncbi:putative methyltransferase domain-containing protein [Trichoderma breve]|uniref:Ribosomal RNA-processing protein 8 n=1 Tax=Trichoderma breve TaxID=2034170 RepID=A0A9W9EDW0_9HYPO|nr:putative methyltransferase domain-containing protein [Trichoderma breve]KAJ4864998.1 putative methyltransferase domain-containing protein [Trichoderma breve]
MFAVPGWSVSSDALKAEKPAVAASSGSAKKRKRTTRDEPVTAANVADLYETVVEGKKPSGDKPAKDSKRQKKSSDDKTKAGSEKSAAEADDAKSQQQASDKKGKKSKKERKESANPNHVKLPKNKERGNRSKPQNETTAAAAAAVESPKSEPKAKAESAAVLPPAPPKLTPLQASMREKLISARFRHLNETLYTRPSEEAFKLFQESPEMFDEYHEGFRRQVKVWPENPLQLIASPLPRTGDTCTIADLGCGDARLAESLQKEQHKLHIDVKSFDLQSPSPLVTKADIANIPMEDGSVNVAIFCLALMGTNWLDFVEEAYRLLHWKGELWVAEIKSRFGPVRNKHAPVTHSVGNRRKQPSKKEMQAKEAEAAGRFEKDLAVEVDGQDDQRRETDVSAFVEALRKRGFVLQGDGREAVDLSNRMFVTMRFIKGAAPTKGKGVKPDDAGPKKKKMFGRMQDEDAEDQGGETEGAILKPCVYKIR